MSTRYERVETHAEVVECDGCGVRGGVRPVLGSPPKWGRFFGYRDPRDLCPACTDATEEFIRGLRPTPSTKKED